jgi:hypothetical protein
LAFPVWKAPMIPENTTLLILKANSGIMIDNNKTDFFIVVDFYLIIRCSLFDY